ncbi:helix-turn-helix domain-containing protein [Paenibacillus sp. MMS20-IR301]|uniref:AraC family transcriptional regulator n=1 Tax=Paenibacillus sp. MMS20-IR301 TaxID=2895946 RepID=UPI0028E79E64|nr:helix-turn-helix domain-containing protein [Paenibacillus sp. MMS20-IR301]WNS43165.1 helix-turn-helix domain-containing protein [Paenibacillus sp. MMS20-IR301]
MNKRNSVFANLAISYISVVLVIVLLICSFFYIYFSGNYKEELRSKNQLMLENTARTIENTVLERVQQIYVEIALGQTAELHLLSGPAYQSNLSKMLDLQEVLKSKAASNSDIVQAIHLYSPEQKVMLSSVYGLKLGADQGDGAAFFAEWINGMSSNKQGSLWTRTRMVSQDIFSSLPGSNDQALITYAHSYPFQASGDNSDLFIAIDVKEQAIGGIIQNMMPSHYESSFVLDRSGKIITGTYTGELDLEGSFGTGITQAADKEAGSFTDTINRIPYVISYQTLPSTQWKIYNAVPANSFYEQSIVVQKLILGICLFAILLGLVLSGILAKVNYIPVKRLAGKIRDLTGPAPEHATNEYRLIDTAFIRLNDKVSSLEDSLQASRAAALQNVVLNMLQGGYTGEELAEELQCLGLAREYSQYCCLLLSPAEASARLSSRNIQAGTEQLIHRLEAVSPQNSRLIAEELPDNKLVVILCTDAADEDLLSQLAGNMLAESRQQLGLGVQIAWGTWVQALDEIHQSYNEAHILMKYGYFLPEISVLNDRLLLKREQCPDEIPQALLTKFKEKLQTRQLPDIVQAIRQLVTAMREGPYAADYCHFILANTVFVYSDYLRSVRHKYPASDHPDLYNQYTGLNHIRHFEEWLVDSVSAFTDRMEKRNSGRAVTSIESAKQYIETHLPDDLSLETVAARVFISPKYLSRLFKEEVGTTYTDYVTGRRMEQAKLLIENNNMTVEQVAETVGYGTTAYFIKRFKEMYGCTPGNYLRSTAEQA